MLLVRPSCIPGSSLVVVDLLLSLASACPDNVAAVISVSCSHAASGEDLLPLREAHVRCLLGVWPRPRRVSSALETRLTADWAAHHRICCALFGPNGLDDFNGELLVDDVLLVLLVAVVSGNEGEGARGSRCSQYLTLLYRSCVRASCVQLLRRRLVRSLVAQSGVGSCRQVCVGLPYRGLREL